MCAISSVLWQLILQQPLLRTCLMWGVPSTPLLLERAASSYGRWRCWGEAFKAELVHGLAQKQQQQCSSAGASVAGVDSRRLSEWQTKELNSHQCVAFRSFGRAMGTFVIASAGARLGHVAEGTHLYMVAHHALVCGSWAVPHVVNSKVEGTHMFRHSLSLACRVPLMSTVVHDCADLVPYAETCSDQTAFHVSLHTLNCNFC